MNCSNARSSSSPKQQPSPSVLRRLEQIESLPPHQQSALLTTIDAFLTGSNRHLDSWRDCALGAFEHRERQLLIVETARSGAAVKDDRREPRSGLAP